MCEDKVICPFYMCGDVSSDAEGALLAIADPDQIPDEFLKVEITPRLNEIKKAIKANPSIDWAYLEDGDNYSLSIR